MKIDVQDDRRKSWTSRIRYFQIQHVPATTKRGFVNSNLPRLRSSGPRVPADPGGVQHGGGEPAARGRHAAVGL